MDPVLVISPHLDDAVLSVGQFLASWPGAVVMSVFAGMPPREKITTFDVNCGFSGSTRALTARWHEDDRALDLLGAKPMRLDYIDNQYRAPEDPVDVGHMIDQIEGSFKAVRACKLIGPMGLAHTDHQVTMNVVAEAAIRLHCETWFYEELPARVLWPEMVPEAVTRLKDVYNMNLTKGFLGEADKDLKRAAVGCYTSQLWALDRDVIFAPERVWRVDW